MNTASLKRVREIDVLGIVGKHSLAPHTTERTIWFKIKNRNYSQIQGREELLERERHKEPVVAGTRVNWRVLSWNRMP
jgi:hypothetical protein